MILKQFLLLHDYIEHSIDFLYPFVVTVFKYEEIPTLEFNRGFITSMYKGKGDKENLCNHRGITTSSTIGTIIETMITLVWLKCVNSSIFTT